MAKLQSNFTNMALSLTCITLVAAAALGGVYNLTKQTIDEQALAKQTAAISAVLPEHDRIADAEEVNGLQVYKAYMGDQFVGAAVESHADGFGGVQRIMIGFDAESNIVNSAVYIPLFYGCEYFVYDVKAEDLTYQPFSRQVEFRYAKYFD